jgi:hypothetical protein
MYNSRSAQILAKCRTFLVQLDALFLQFSEIETPNMVDVLCAQGSLQESAKPSK